MMQDSGHTFRLAAGRFASGVTVSSFASLSLNPLLVTVSISQSSQLLEHVRSVEAFAVSVLANDQQQVARYFATSGRRPEAAGFSAVPTIAHETGAPIIEGCLSWFDCILEDILPGGDHEILVGRVAAAGGRSGEPLVYWAGGYRALTAEALQSDQLANASDGLAVAYHILDVGASEMLEAQDSIEPAIAALAAARTPTAEWRRLEELVDQSELVVDQPEEFNRLALRLPRCHRRGIRKSCAAGRPREPQSGAIRPLPRPRQSELSSGRGCGSPETAVDIAPR